MSKITRRSFVGGSAALPVAFWLHGCGGSPGPGGGGNGGGGAPEPTPEPIDPAPPSGRVRHDARSPDGQAMLQIYANAVNTMKTAIAEGDPRSWLFQWYTHGVGSAPVRPTAEAKTREINRIYPSPSPERDLANDMWNTCRAHSPGQIEDDFLPWHRMYLYYFEQIIREVSGEDAFTLPYWDYSNADPAVHGIIPEQFRMSSDSTLSSLFEDNRNPGVNTGRAIDEGRPGNPLSLVALEQCTYGAQGVAAGFNQTLDFGLHGQVHVLTGTATNMGDVPTAAGDPIFWLHHCNVDRLWASWNAGGRDNPGTAAWLDQEFVFANADGARVVGRTSDVADLSSLDYSYDRLEPVPACPDAASPLAGAADSFEAVTVAEAAPGGLTATSRRITLDPPATPLDGGVAATMSERVRDLEDHRLYLVARGLASQGPPGVLYNIYLNLPEGASPEQQARHHAGIVGFFSFGHAEADPDRFHSFDVTELAQQLRDDGALDGVPSVTIAPAGEPDTEAQPVIGQIELVEQ